MAAIGLFVTPSSLDGHVKNGLDSYVFFTIGPNLRAGALLEHIFDVRTTCALEAAHAGRGFSTLVTRWMNANCIHYAMGASRDAQGVLVGMLPGPS